MVLAVDLIRHCDAVQIPAVDLDVHASHARDLPGGAESLAQDAFFLKPSVNGIDYECQTARCDETRRGEVLQRFVVLHVAVPGVIWTVGRGFIAMPPAATTYAVASRHSDTISGWRASRLRRVENLTRDRRTHLHLPDSIHAAHC